MLIASARIADEKKEGSIDFISFHKIGTPIHNPHHCNDQLNSNNVSVKVINLKKGHRVKPAAVASSRREALDKAIPVRSVTTV